MTRELFHNKLIISVVGSICQRISNMPLSFYRLILKILDLLIFFAQIEVKILWPITVYLYTNENFCCFLLAQQDETKSVIPKRISYSYNFEKYIQSYLPSFSIDVVEKYDLYSNKHTKYLFYKFNDWIESMEGEKLLIRHTAKTKDDFSLKTIESRDRQFLIEKLIHSIEFKDHYQKSTEKTPQNNWNNWK